jgi:hypothetical protein
MTRNDLTRLASFAPCLVCLVACGTSAEGSATPTGGAAGQQRGGADSGATSAGGATHGGGVSGGAGGTSSADSAAGGAGHCPGFVACGGNLVGRWKVVKVCASAAESKKLGDDVEFCADSSIVATVTATGFVDFDAQGALKFDTVTAAHLVESIPTSCVVAKRDCAGVQAAIAAEPGTTMATCQTTAAGCDCIYDVRAPHRVEDSYVASGTQFTDTSPGDGKKTISEYCVEGTSLRISDDSAAVELVSSP